MGFGVGIGIVVVLLLLVGFVLAYNRLQRLVVKVEEAGAGIDVALEKRWDLLNELLEAVKKYLSHEYETLTGVVALRSNTNLENRRFEQQTQLSEETMQSIDQEIERQSKNLEQIRHNLKRGNFHHKNSRDFQGKAREDMKHFGKERSAAVSQKINALTSVHHDLNGVTTGIDALYEQYPLLNSWISLDQYQRSAVNVEEHLQAARRLYNSNVSLLNQTIRTFPWLIVANLCKIEPAEFYEVEESKRNFKASFD